MVPALISLKNQDEQSLNSRRFGLNSRRCVVLTRSEKKLSRVDEAKVQAPCLSFPLPKHPSQSKYQPIFFLFGARLIQESARLGKETRSGKTGLPPENHAVAKFTRPPRQPASIDSVPRTVGRRETNQQNSVSNLLYSSQKTRPSSWHRAIRFLAKKPLPKNSHRSSDSSIFSKICFISSSNSRTALSENAPASLAHPTTFLYPHSPPLPRIQAARLGRR